MSGPLTSSVCVCLVVWNKTLDASLSPNHITITPTYPNKQSITFYRDHYLKQLSKWENYSTQTDSLCQSPKNHFYNILKEPKINQNLKVLHCKCWTCTIEQKYSTSGEETFDFRQKKPQSTFWCYASHTSFTDFGCFLNTEPSWDPKFILHNNSAIMHSVSITLIE